MAYTILLALWTILVLLFVQVAYKIITLTLENRRLKKALSDFPGPKPHWLWGNVKELSRGEDAIKKLREWRRKYGPVFPVWFGPTFVSLSTTDPGSVKAILSTTAPKNPFTYDFVFDWIGDGLLISKIVSVTKGQKWKRNRRLLTPAFHFDILKPYVNIYSKCLNVMVENWRKILNKPNPDPLEMFHHVSLMTLDSLLKCVMGYHGPSVQMAEDQNPYISDIKQISELFVNRIRTPYLHSPFLFSILPIGKRYKKLCDSLHRFTRSVINQKKQEMETGQDKINNNNDLKNSEKKNGPRLDFLEILLRVKDSDGNGLTDTEIQHEVDTSMFEGHDTTASGLSWCCYNMARFPDIQERCRQEVNQVLGDRQDISWEDLLKLPYLTQCIKESLRLHPPVPNISRKIDNPLPFPDGRVAPAGTTIGINIWALHHNEEVWPNPDVYDPDRFSPDNVAKRSPHAFVPFSSGPRNCIGKHFAMNEMKSAMSLILKNFKLEVDESRQPQPIAEVVLRSKNELWLKVQKIN